MNHKLILGIFAILLFLGVAPFSFTATPDPYLFGWLPLSLGYWWVLMAVNLVFVLWVAKEFVKHAKEEE